MSKKETHPIDFVIIWVDGNDPDWLKQYSLYKGEDGDQRSTRFRDTETLKYWFRGVEKFAPWVNKVYFVTCGQRPEWLNTDNPKLVCVDHKDFIPEKYLPTFSSHCIEHNLHRIQGLSEHFVYFNDDMFLVQPVSQEDFFCDGLPCDAAILNYEPMRTYPPFLVPYSNISVINRNFSKKQVIKKNASKMISLKYHKFLFRSMQLMPGKWFPGFKIFHLPTSFLKSTFNEVWSKEGDVLDATCMHKFRVLSDVNQWLIQEWQYCTGSYYPRDINIGLRCSNESKEDVNKTTEMIVNGKYKLICANDDGIEDFDYFKERLIGAFEQILPEKSGFEV
ncbi:MAG: Stealth CR1 domain-containing protein [Firmicutes bacterium]|nr:Stealth CR1 domain-containing protein [Bacillota bacterium]